MQIKTFKPEDHKLKVLVYGAAKSGKTTFSGTAKNAIYASAEGGLLSIADKHPKFVEIKSLKDLNDLHAYLSDEEHPFETVVIDSITEINDIIKTEIEKRLGRSMQLQDWGELSKKIRDIFRRFRDLPMNVILIAQEQYITDEDKIKKIVPSMNGKAATDVAYFMDVVGYMNVEADGTRWIETDTNKRLLTGDRTNLIGNNAPADFTEWQKRMAKMETGTQEVVEEYKVVEEARKTPAQAVPQKAGHPHLLSLQNELKKRGATDVASALLILNEGLTDPYANLNLSEEDASHELVRLLQKEMPDQKPNPAPDLLTHPAILKEASKKSKKSTK